MKPMANKTRIQKKLGRPVEFQGCNGYGVINGVVESIRRGYATIRYYRADREDGSMVHNPEGFIALLRVNDSRLVQIF